MKRLLVNVGLFIVAVLLLSTIGVFGLLFTTIYSIWYFKKLSFFNYWGDLMYSINVGIDKIGNVLLGAFLNKFAIIERTYPFGSVNHTISHVLAVNYFNKNLTNFGCFVVRSLQFIDKNHMEDSVEMSNI